MPDTVQSSAYKQVADSLRQKILNGEVSSGERLPTERDLCEQFSASRITIRRALQVLADEMLIQRRHGSGTFVSPTPSRRIPLLNTDFSGSIAAHAPDLQRQLESWEWQTATAEIADMLQIDLGERILFARRIDVLDDKPVAYDEVYLTEKSANRLDKNDLGELRFLEHWQKVQDLRIEYLTQSIEAIAAETSHCRHLGGKKNQPLLKEIDVVFLESSQACGVFISYYRSDLFRLTSTIRIQPAVDGEST
jgi:DNA-binding GntR family transcriptional regulator